MEKLSQKSEDVLQDYLDAKLSPSQCDALERSLNEKPVLRKRLEELKLADSILRNLSAEEPSKNFTSQVMTRLDKYPLKTGLTITNGILLFSGILIVIALAVILLSAGIFDQRATFDLNHINVVHFYLKQSLPEISVNGKLIVSIIVALNLGLAFMVLDRAILKPFFRRRLESSSHH